jgi:circadian clock protein KaiB
MPKELTPKTAPCPNTPETWELILFVMGTNPMTGQIRSRLEHLCKVHLKNRCRIEVVDILENPERAHRFDIIAIPTLIRKHPEPVRRVFGDLTQTQKVLAGLGISAAEMSR